MHQHAEFSSKQSVKIKQSRDSSQLGTMLPATHSDKSRTGILNAQVRLIYRSGTPRRVDFFFENLVGLSQKYGSIGDISPLQQFLTASEAGIEYTFVPYPVRLGIKYLAVPLAKLVGYKPYYKEYRSDI